MDHGKYIHHGLLQDIMQCLSAQVRRYLCLQDTIIVHIVCTQLILMLVVLIQMEFGYNVIILLRQTFVN